MKVEGLHAVECVGASEAFQRRSRRYSGRILGPPVLRRWRKSVTVAVAVVLLVGADVHTLQRRRRGKISGRRFVRSSLSLLLLQLLQLVLLLLLKDVDGRVEGAGVGVFVMRYDVGIVLEGERAFAAGDGVIAAIVPKLPIHLAARGSLLLLLLLLLLHLSDQRGRVGSCGPGVRLLQDGHHRSRR